MGQQDDTSYTDILHLRKIKMNINKKLSAAKVQKKMTDFFKKNNQWILQYLQAHYAIFSLVSAFSQKNRTYKMGLRVCVCVSVYSFGPPLIISIPVMRLIRNFGYI